MEVDSIVPRKTMYFPEYKRQTVFFHFHVGEAKCILDRTLWYEGWRGDVRRIGVKTDQGLAVRAWMLPCLDLYSPTHDTTPSAPSFI